MFRFLILKFNLKTPGREEEEEETKLYSKKEYRERAQKVSQEKMTDEERYLEQAKRILEALGGKENIVEVTNCVTRLRVKVKEESIVEGDTAFKEAGAKGVVRNGNSFQIIIGFSVGQVRAAFDSLL